MKKSAVLLLALSQGLLVYPSVVTYKFSGGRFGDNLIAFARALWVSHATNIPLHFRSFAHAKKLKLYALKHQNRALPDTLQVQRVKTQEEFRRMSNAAHKYYTIDWRTSFYINWQDPQFKARLKRLIASKQPVTHYELPNDKLLVAAHIRVGNGPDRVKQNLRSPAFDPDTNTQHLRKKKRPADVKLPNKFPPTSFFVQQIRRLSSMLDDQPMYVHVFTDSKTPEKLVELLQERVGKENITYGFKKNAGLFDDFFNMARFNYFIRPQSSFSFMADKIADWKIVIYPEISTWQNEALHVKKVTTLVNKDV